MDIYTFNAKYYDGKSSLGFDAQVDFLSENIIISYQNAAFESIVVVWEIAEVVSADHLSKTKASIQYGPFPHQYIETTDVDCIAIYRKKYLKDPYFIQLYHKAINGNRSLVAISAILVVLFGLLGYFVALPQLADYFAEYGMSRDWEISLGESIYKNITNEMEVDSAKSQWANEFLAETGFQTTYPVEITVVDSKIHNAFAAPGGHIVIFDTLLTIIETPDELAALIGHELTHVEKRHSTRMLCRNLAGYIFISFISGDINGISAVLVENAHAIAGLQYIRSLEEEADKNGIALLQSSQLNPTGMVALLTHLQKVEENKNNWLRLLMSHPMTNERIDYCKKEIKKSKSQIQTNEKLAELFKKLKADS